MTIKHLVISDTDTIDRLFDQLRANGMAAWHTTDGYEAWDEDAEQVWTLTTPGAIAQAEIQRRPLSADFIYLGSSVVNAACDGLMHHERVLPLIAACDLLGVDKL